MIYVTIIAKSMFNHMSQVLKEVTDDRLSPFAENDGNVEQKRLHLTMKTMVTVYIFTLKLISSAAETSKSIKYCKPRQDGKSNTRSSA